MTERLRDRLSREAARNFVGRSSELSALLSLLDEPDTRIVFVHGIGGIGKSRLLDVFAAQAQTQGAVVRLDCQTIKPTEAGFLHELSTVMGQKLDEVEQAAVELGKLGARVILALDNYEVFRMADTWLRQVFIPALPEHVRTIFLGREAPVSAWYTTPGWQGLVRSIELRSLDHADSEQLLRRLGVPESDLQRVTQFTQGHPLALTLAAATIAQHPHLALKEVESQHVVTELTRLYLADVPDAMTRTALEAGAVVRRVTRSLLNAMLPDSQSYDPFERLQALPFVESASDGLVIHDLVRQAIVTRLRAADPERYHTYRRAAWNQLRSEFSIGSRATIWRYTADMVYLIDHPAVHEAFFPSDAHLYAVEQATPDDEAAISAITLRHDGPDMLDIIQYWWRVMPEAFYAVRGRHADVEGFYCMFQVRPLTNRLRFDDPVTRLMWQHLQANPIGENQIALFAVRWVAAEMGDAPSPVQGSLWLDIKRAYMEYPQTRRIYTIFQTKPWVPVFEQLGFRGFAPDLTLDDKQFTLMMNDFGPQLVPGWMAGLIDTQLGIAPSVVLHMDAHELVVGSRHISLTPLEFDLMHYLIQHEGKVVTRDELLDAVWGYEWNGGSNVVDAMVRSLRKKMGDQANCIETVKGVGYKLHWT